MSISFNQTEWITLTSAIILFNIISGYILLLITFNWIIWIAVIYIIRSIVSKFTPYLINSRGCRRWILLFIKSNQSRRPSRTRLPCASVIVSSVRRKKKFARRNLFQLMHNCTTLNQRIMNRKIWCATRDRDMCITLLSCADGFEHPLGKVSRIITKYLPTNQPSTVYLSSTFRQLGRVEYPR